jgi:hypothetical protein
VVVSIGCEPEVAGIKANPVSKLDVEVREKAGVDILVDDNPEPDAMLEEADPELDVYEFGNSKCWFRWGWRDRARAVLSSLFSRACSSSLVSSGMGSITS